MGLVMKEEHIDTLKRISDRERAPMYVIGEATGDNQFCFVDKDGNKPIDLQLADMFGNPPKTVLTDCKPGRAFSDVSYLVEDLKSYI